MEHSVPPNQNDVEELKIVLDVLAKEHAVDISNSKNPEKPSEFGVKGIRDLVTSLNVFNTIDSTTLNHSLDHLQSTVNGLFVDSNIFVKSIGKKLTAEKNTDNVKVSFTRIVPPVFDALTCIFALSNEKFRQKHFESLVDYYFDSLTTSLRKVHSDYADNIDKSYCERQVRILLPVVKLEQAGSLGLENLQKTQDLIENIKQFFKYPIINQEDVYEVTRAIHGSTEYDLLDYSLTGLAEKNGHLGEYFHLNIKMIANEGKQEFQLFGKFLIKTEEFAKNIVENGPAKKEDFFYKTFIPLCIEHGLENLLDFAPKCYLSRINYLLILDDLSQQGYVGLRPNQLLEYEGLKVSINNLSKLHACTLILEEQMSRESGKTIRLSDIYGEHLGETIYIQDETNKPIFDKELETLLYVADKVPDITQKLNLSKEELKKKLSDVFYSMFPKIKKSDSVRNVINHGDMYVANMLFKFNDNKIVTEGLLIDFQILRYISPNFDLLFLIYENSSKDTRDTYFNKLTKEYYDSLSENLIKFDLDPSDIFPKEVFETDVKHMMSAGLASAFMYSQFCHIESDFRTEVFSNQERANYYLYENKNELIEIAWKHESYRNILSGIIEDMVNLIKEGNNC